MHKNSFSVTSIDKIPISHTIGMKSYICMVITDNDYMG